MSVKEFRAARPRAELSMGPVRVQGKVAEYYTEDLRDYLRCDRGVCLYVFVADKFHSLLLRLWFEKRLIAEKRRFFLKSWLEHFGPGFRRTTMEIGSRGVTLLGPRLVWRTDWGNVMLCVPPELEGVMPQEAQIRIDVSSDGKVLNLGPHPPEKHRALFRCVDEVLRDLKTGNANSRKEGPMRAAPLKSHQARAVRSSPDEIVIVLRAQGEGPNAKLRIVLDYIAVADVEELRGLLKGLSKVPGATKRPVTLAVSDEARHEWVAKILGILNECGYRSINFKQIGGGATPNP